MLQVLGEAMLTATRTERYLYDPRRDEARPLLKEAESPQARRRGWLHFAGILL